MVQGEEWREGIKRKRGKGKGVGGIPVFIFKICFRIAYTFFVRESQKDLGSLKSSVLTAVM